LVAARRVLVSGAVADKTARQVAAAEPLVVSGPPARFASRGGEKLEAALAYFAIDVTGRHALDAGASTGGFTDCLLQRGAASVVAVDVGHGQLLPRLRSHPAVEVLERVNIRSLSPADLDGRRFAIVVADLSFISLATVASALVSLAEPGGDMVVLVKPQFEAGRQIVSRGHGVVRQPEVRAEALRRAAEAFAQAGAVPVAAMPSPLAGAEGNLELLLHLRPAAATGPADLVDRAGLDAVAMEGKPWRP
jgi:23S rRNA (cytidine1920-2'-O)/16S rRNA (cytidine1409-2'-O)-methyltransferase